MSYNSHSRTCWIEMLGVEIELEVEYTYAPGTADSYHEPGDPPEVELLSAVTTDGRDILEYLSTTRPDPAFEIVEERRLRWIHARQSFTDSINLAEPYTVWVVKVVGETYYDQILNDVFENHEDDGGYDDYDWDDRG